MQNAHSQPWRWSAATVTDQVARRKISCREVAESVLERLATVNPGINVVVDVMADEALAAADQADGSEARDESIGPLHGVPITIKVNVDVAGHANTGGITFLRDNIAATDAPLVANLRRAGAIIIGRTNTPCFSIRWFTDNELHGRTLNPWNPDVTPGGSSGGAAAAVATGIGAIGHGNDYGGSIRHPAWACGVVGLRPTPGRVPSYNESSQTERTISNQLMSVQGPLTRSVADASAALRVMSQGDPRDPAWSPVPHDLPHPGGPLRIALFRSPGHDVDPSVLGALDQAASWLDEAGCIVTEVTPPRFDEAAELWAQLVWDDFRRAGIPAIDANGDAAVRRSAELYLANSPEGTRDDYLDRLATRLTIAREWSEFFAQHPVLLTANSWERQFPIDDDQRSPERMGEILRAQSPLLGTAMLGLPGLSIPVGVTDRLPTGVQLVADRFREDLLVEAGQLIEDRADFDAVRRLVGR